MTRGKLGVCCLSKLVVAKMGSDGCGAVVAAVAAQ
jgi:hypothetical protein